MNICYANLILLLAYAVYLIAVGWRTSPKAMGPTSTSTVEQVAIDLLQTIELQLVSCKILQSLWAGYGHICHIIAETDSRSSSEPVSLILKHINPPSTQTNGSLPNEGHIRKILSYQVEQYFYVHLAPKLPQDLAVASCIASVSPRANGHATAMLLSDLRRTHPVAGEKRSELTEKQTYAALQWLAHFHGFWWARVQEFDQHQLALPPLEHFQHHGDTGLKNEGVWLNGGYTYLATRRSEYNSLASDTSSEWSEPFCLGSPSLAEIVSTDLAPANEANAEYVTLIHGDVKSENLFSTEDGSSVAFYDFQYVGLGLGVCDLAKLFTCSVPEYLLPAARTMGDGEEKLLRFYHSKLESFSAKQYPWDIFVKHWELALLDWLRFQASWGMWGNTAWLEERCRGILSNRS